MTKRKEGAVKKMYFAGKYELKYWLRKIRGSLDGHVKVTSSWLNEEEPGDIQIADVSTSKLIGYALQDVADIIESDTLVHFQSKNDPNLRGGAIVEFGIALAKKKELVVVGDRINIFDHLPKVRHFSCALGFIEWAKEA